MMYKPARSGNSAWVIDSTTNTTNLPYVTVAYPQNYAEVATAAS